MGYKAVAGYIGWSRHIRDRVEGGKERGREECPTICELRGAREACQYSELAREDSAM